MLFKTIGKEMKDIKLLFRKLDNKKKLMTLCIEGNDKYSRRVLYYLSVVKL